MDNSIAKYTSRNNSLYMMVLLSIIWTKTTLIQFVRAVLLRIPVLWNYVDILIPFCIFVSVVLALPDIIKKARICDVALYLSICTIYIMDMLIYPNSEEILVSYAVSFLLLTVPYYFIGLAINIAETKDLFQKLSTITVACMFIYRIVLKRGSDMRAYVETEDMWQAYCLLPHVMFVAHAFISKRKWTYGILSILGLFQLVSYGTRGPILCFFCFICFYVFIFHKPQKPILYFTILLGIITIIVLNMNSIISLFEELSEKAGMSARIFEKIKNGDMLNSSGRNWIQEAILDAAREHPAFGLGFAGDQSVMNYYSHNIAIELWVSFGFIFGSIILICIVSHLAIAFVIEKDQNKRILLAILVISFFVKLFISSSYMSEPMLFLCLGICSGIRRNSSIEKGVSSTSSCKYCRLK